MSKYVPVSCADYSRYELAIVRRRRLHLVWGDSKILHNETVTPVDLTTRDGQEFLVARDHNGTTIEIRLDRIKRNIP